MEIKDMKIKIIGTQIYEDHEEKIKQEFDNVIVEMEDIIAIKYEKGEIIYNKNTNVIELKSDNNIIVELNKEKILNYNTPYGIINLKTFGEDIFIGENPFKLVVKYNLKLNEKVEYKNILEIYAE